MFTPKPTAVVLHLLTKNGPQTSKQLARHLPDFPQLKSKNYLKKYILKNMKLREQLFKKKSRNPELTKSAGDKAAYLWFINNEKVDTEKYKKLPVGGGQSYKKRLPIAN
ncbi:18826_t:CDS:1, partial [Dentiscutata erythropus]